MCSANGAAFVKKSIDILRVRVRVQSLTFLSGVHVEKEQNFQVREIGGGD